MERSTDGTKTSILGSSKRKQKLYTWLRRIYNLTMLLIFILALLNYCNFGESFHEKQSTRLADIPGRFFPSHSSVSDYPLGNLQPVIKLLEDEELIFVMYYAPWCAESSHVRGEFINAAKVLSNTVKFVAVNCWFNSGECRQRMKFMSFPELFVYHTGVQDGYRFTGNKQAEYFVRFVESFLFPLQPLYTEREIREYTTQQDNTVIGYFDFNSSPQPPGSAFHQFYLTALRITSYDYYQPVRFGVVQSKKLAQLLNLASPGRFVFTRIGNITLKYPLFFNMTSKNMTSWISYHKQKSIAQWLVPPGIKSLTLSLPMQQGPAVFMFAPVNPLLDFNPYLSMVRIASHAYSSCGNHTGIYQAMMKNTVHDLYNKLYRDRLLYKRCQEKKTNQNSGQEVPYSNSKCCISLLYGSRKFSQNNICEYCVQRNSNRDTVCDINLEPEVTEDWTIHMNSCSDFYQFYNVNEHRSVCCKKSKDDVPMRIVGEPVTEKVRRNTDPYVINGESMLLKRKCGKFTLQKLKSLITLEELSKSITRMSDVDMGNFTGLQCRTNKTVKFYFLDNVYHSVFVEMLGFSLSSQRHEASVILVDMQDEAKYILNENLDFQNLASFVVNYTQGSLVRYRRSSEVSSTSDYDSESNICITEVTAKTFHSVVMDNTKDVLLLYYTPWCGFCSTFSQTYLALAQYFSTTKNILFARVNADRNDLPWEFTVDKYPTILFFPATRKSESVMFPESVPKTLPNLIKFLSYYANQSVQLDTAINVCTKACVAKNIDKVLHEISRLKHLVGQLQRRATTLWSQTADTNESRRYLHTAAKTDSMAHEIKMFKLHKAQLLNYFLQNNLKKLDRAMFLEFIDKY